MTNATTALAELHERYAACYAAKERHPTTEYISGWNAPCYRGKPASGEIGWEAVPQEPELDFSGVEHALEMSIDQGVKDFYKAYYAGDMYVRFRDRPLVLLQVIHPEDGERLLKNLIGHVMMKQRLEQAVTLFIGLTDEDDLMLTVNNQTGAVGLEYVGKDQHEILAGDMESFLRRLDPVYVDESE
ncbi:SecY-interacting protein [Aliidiomarina sanyensis]|uniref:Protein Syd n=1 Tax=Aliidiomarina sanyensis TaxID=1249555 RepID=A0A432WR88_9GAMM|nr:SecY-interacting protein [Aliidiomarina sanyensis]RUO36303.1 SecY-interacting protein [Aliidiomarina sanyensis]